MKQVTDTTGVVDISKTTNKSSQKIIKNILKSKIYDILNNKSAIVKCCCDC